MPLLQVKLIEGVFSAKQKRQMIEKLTETMVAIEGENMRGVTSVIVEEVKSDDWGIGGDFMHVLLDEEFRDRKTGHKDVNALIHVYVNRYSISTGMITSAVGLGAKWTRCSHGLRSTVFPYCI